MSNQVQIKVHDVFHNKEDFNVSQAEEYIKSWITGVDVENIRIAPGESNSPIFITLNKNSVSMREAKRIAREAVSGFSEIVTGVNVDTTISDKNIRVMNK